jgi:heptosyltransferase-2
LKKACPEARITYLTKRVYAPVLEGNPSIEAIAGLKRKPRGGEMFALLRLCRGLGKFDVVVDLHGTLRSRLACAAVRTGRTLRYEKDSLMRRFWIMGWKRGVMERERRHMVERYLEAVRPLGVEPGGLMPEVHLRDDEAEDAVRFLRERGVKDPGRFAVLVPGARWPNKRWTTEGFAGVGKWLSEKAGMEVVLAGDGTDREWAEKIAELLGGRCVTIAGETGLRQLAAVLKKARVVVGNDSGPGHLAAAVGTPVVALFGPTSEAFGFRPLGERTRVVSHALDCRPCSLHGGKRCPRGRRSCLDDIEPAEVIGAVREVTDLS